MMRGDLSRAALEAVELARLTREHALPIWRAAYGIFFDGLASAQRGTAGGGLEEMRRGIELLREQNVLIFDGLLKIALADAEARAGDVDRALATLNEALETCDRTGHRSFEAELHRVRGETLLKRDPRNPAPAEEAFQSAIAIARHQGARSFELRASLSMAKLYQSTGRPADAHAILAPALEGFSPTSEMAEIAEAQALLVSLAESDEVKAAEAAAAATAAPSNSLRPSHDVDQGLRCRGNQGRLRARRRICRAGRGRFYTPRRLLRAVLGSMVRGEYGQAQRNCRDLSAGGRGGRARNGGRRRSSHARPHFAQPGRDEAARSVLNAR